MILGSTLDGSSRVRDDHHVTTTPRYIVHSTGPRVHYCLDTETQTLYGPHKSKRSARAITDEKNDR